MKRPEGERISISKPLLFKMIGYEIYTDEVRRMHESTARVKIMSAPARTSKSYSAAADVLWDCFPDFWRTKDGTIYPMPLPNSQHTRLIWIVAPDYKLAKEFDYLYSWLVDNRGKYGFGYQLEKAQNSPDQGAMKIQILWGKDWTGSQVRTVIEGKSSTNEKSLQAEEVYRVILSEAADQDERVWAKYLSTRYGAALFPTTPKVKADWIRKMIEQGAENPRLKVESFDYDGRCNPGYDWERYWIEHAKAESRMAAPETTLAQNEAVPPSLANGHDCFGIGEHCYASRDPHFAEQFMGRWTYAESRVLSFRWKALGKRISHVIEHLPDWVQHADKYVSMDYGFTDPAAAAYFAVHHDGTVIMLHEIYQPGLTPEEFAQRVLEVPREKGWRIKQFLSDPRKPEVLRHFQRLGVACMRVDKNRQSDRQAGFMAIQDYLSDDPILGRPKLFISRHCTHAIDEMKLLRRKDGHTGDEFSTAAIAGADHLCDSLRYFLTVFPRADSPETKAKTGEMERIFAMARENAKLERRLRPAASYRSAQGGVPGMIQ